jgi:hypothetical protein
MATGDAPGVPVTGMRGYGTYHPPPDTWSDRSSLPPGDDTDTTAAVTGGFAALLYGWENIPPEWVNLLAKKGWY